MLLDPPGQEHFENLAAEGAFLEIKGVARQLLRYRARPLLHPALPVIADGCTEYAEIIDPVMLKEPVILFRHHSIHHPLGNLIIGNRETILDEDFPDLLARAVIDDTCRFHLGKFIQIKGVSLLVKLGIHPAIDD